MMMVLMTKMMKITMMLYTDLCLISFGRRSHLNANSEEEKQQGNKR